MTDPHPHRSTVSYVSVGSNIDPEHNIALALSLLKRRVAVEASSTFFRTAPLNRPEQPLFWNGVWQICSRLSWRALKFDVLRSVEEAVGRRRTADLWAARTIDLDLILHGECVVDTEEIALPDPDIFERPFVAYPLLELAPSLVLPGTGQHLCGLSSARVDDSLVPLERFTEQLRERLCHE